MAGGSSEVRPILVRAVCSWRAHGRSAEVISTITSVRFSGRRVILERGLGHRANLLKK